MDFSMFAENLKQKYTGHMLLAIDIVTYTNYVYWEILPLALFTVLRYETHMMRIKQ